MMALTALFSSMPVVAQDVTTEGTEFWVSFMGNGFKDRYDPWTGEIDFTWIRTQLIISAKRQTHCQIKNPNTAYQDNFTVEANDTYTFEIPEEEAYMELSEYGQILGKGLVITSNDSISVYCANIAEMSFDASYVLPIHALADDYLIQTYDQSTGSSLYYDDYYTSSILIIAAEDGETTVDITPSVNTLDGHPANQEFNITLHKGEVYQIRSHNSYGSRDLSGSRVTARDCKKIAVFNGNNLTMVPSSGSDSDCIFEQAMPLQAWGKQFVATSSMGRQLNDFVKITSAHDNNSISINGQPSYTLSAGESVIFEMNNSSCFIDAEQSCAVYMYNHSKDNDYFNLGQGAPSMVWIAPVEQRINQLTFSTFNYESEHDTDIEHQFVNIIVKADDADNVTLDDEQIAANLFEAVNGTDEYKFYRKEITHGVHHISCPGGFNAHIYGYSMARGYAYMAGSKAANLSTSIIIDDISVSEGDTVVNCTLEPIVFRAEVNYSNYNVTWDFGDGNTSNESVVQHSYADNGFYTVNITVRTAETACTSSTEQVTTFYIDARREDDEEYTDNACIGRTYTGHGFVDVPIVGDTILIRPIDSNLPENCKGNVIVHILAHEAGYMGPFEAHVCFTGPDVYEGYGITIPYDHPGVYDTIVAFPGEYGCDSYTEVILNVGNVVETEPEVLDACLSYTWDVTGQTYYESQMVSDTIADPETGCYEIKHLDLTILYEPDSCRVHALYNTTAPWVIPGNEFQTNAYTFAIKKNALHPEHSDYDSVTWQLNKYDSITGQFTESGLNWRLVTSGAKNDTCKVYVFNHTDGLVWLRATLYNGCSTGGVTINDYWLRCSFYDVDENLDARANFTVLPNPNNGQMELRFEQFTSEVDVKVYDMHGILVDEIRIGNGINARSYDMSHRSNGVYFFIASGKEGTITRKVVLTK